MNNRFIRRASSDDLPALANLDPIVRAGSSRQQLIEGAIARQDAWVAIGSDQIVGYGIMSHEFFDRSFLDLIFIEHSQRAQGFGPELISFLEAQSQSEDLFTSTNESNLHMRHVLDKLGYEQSGVIHNLDPGDPEIIYIKRRTAGGADYSAR